MSGSELLSTLDQLDADLARRQTYRLQVIAALDSIGHAEEIGAHDTVQLLAFRFRLDRPEAHRDVRLARALPKYDVVSTALDNGISPSAGEPLDHSVQAEVLHPAQAEAIVSALERVPDTVPVEDLEVAEQQLVNLARHLSPGELRRAGKQIRDLLDTDGPEPDEQKAYARESLTLNSAENGVKFRGYLANENAELLRALIHAGARPHKTLDGELDPRPRDKRQADALTTALTAAATAYDTGTLRPTTQPGATNTNAAAAGATDATGSAVPGFGAKATITVTIDLQDLKSATADATGGLVYGDGLSAAAIRRLACDGKVIPLVLGSNSEPLDVGRAERLVTRAMRRALNARDKGCVVCGAPPIQCDAHHLRSWVDGGETAVRNLVLLCRRHHIDLHAGYWTITITNGVVNVARPTWADPPPPTFRPPPVTPSQVSPVAPPSRSRRTDASGRTDAPASAVGRASSANPSAGSGTGPPATPAADTTNTASAVGATDAAPGAGTTDAASAAGTTDAAPGAGATDAVGGGLAVERLAGSPFVSSNPWGDDTSTGRPERVLGRSDSSTLEEAARFAVWGGSTRTEPPSRVT